MYAEVTEGVKVSVTTEYKKELSDVQESQYYFCYKIRLENLNSYRVRLVNRHWDIFDSLNGSRQVEGPGVVGEQPDLAPEESFFYISGCEIQSELGYMKGYYLFENLETGEYFQVRVPRFDLMCDNRLN